MSKRSATKTSLFRRHPIITAAALLVTMGLAAISLFLATFDLNAYKQTLAEQLGKALDQPVSIGSADMSWRGGPVFNITTVRIGPEDAEAIGQITHLFLQPRLLPLLTGKIVFDNMVVDHPRYHLQLVPRAPATDHGGSTVLLTALLQTVQVRNLTVIDGQLTLDDQREGAAAAPLKLDAIDLRIRNLSSKRPCRLSLSSRLQQSKGAASLSAEGRIILDADLRHWRRARGNFQIRMQDIYLDRLRAYFPLLASLPLPSGKADLQLATEGCVADGLRFSADLAGKGLHLTWPGRYSHPPSLSHFSADGLWTVSKNLNRLSDLKVRLDDLDLKGHLSLQHDSQQPWLEGSLASSPLPLADIQRFLPEHIRLAEPDLLQTSFEHGRIQIHRLRFSGPLQQFRQVKAGLPITDALVTFSEGRLLLPPAPALNQVAFTLTLQNGQLHLSRGSASLLKGPIRFSGTAQPPSAKKQSITFSAEWDAPAAELLPTRAKDAKAGGHIPVMLSLSGTPGNLHGRLQANLGGCAVELPEIFVKTMGSPGDIRLSIHQRQRSWIVEQGLLNLEPFDLRVSGRIDPEAAAPLNLQLELLPVDLAKATQMVPVLAKHRTLGSIALKGQLSGTATKPNFTGKINLADAGLSLKGVLADLRDINGGIFIHNRQCQFSDVKARLGQSTVNLNGTINDWLAPSLELHVMSDGIRADELIFAGSDLVFRNVDGSMLISKKGLRYQKVLLDLTDSRHFSLQGEQLHTIPATVDLDIHAEQASIDEVLSLWSKNGRTTADDSEQHPQSRINIRAAIDRGTYGPLSFTDAQGVIVAEHGRIDITPLVFHTGSGSCQGELHIDHRDEQQSVLDFAAQMDEIDTEHLYSDLMQHRGLVTGKLSGKVQVRGPVGREFLKRGSGHAEIHIKDGVLRKFSFLSKIFSLLNVSQIFTLHLPDMASEGMPFTALDATLTLQDGQLATEDMAVESNAMNLSLVGGYDLRKDQFDLVLGMKPFGTVDKIVSKIPLAGWILTGENKALITAYFRIAGPSDEPEVTPIPVTSISGKVLGIFKRVLGLPGKMVSDVEQLFQAEDQEKKQPVPPSPPPGNAP